MSLEPLSFYLHENNCIKLERKKCILVFSIWKKTLHWPPSIFQFDHHPFLLANFFSGWASPATIIIIIIIILLVSVHFFCESFFFTSWLIIQLSIYPYAKNSLRFCAICKYLVDIRNCCWIELKLCRKTGIAKCMSSIQEAEHHWVL